MWSLASNPTPQGLGGFLLLWPHNALPPRLPFTYGWGVRDGGQPSRAPGPLFFNCTKPLCWQREQVQRVSCPPDDLATHSWSGFCPLSIPSLEYKHLLMWHVLLGLDSCTSSLQLVPVRGFLLTVLRLPLQEHAPSQSSLTMLSTQLSTPSWLGPSGSSAGNK